MHVEHKNFIQLLYSDTIKVVWDFFLIKLKNISKPTTPTGIARGDFGWTLRNTTFLKEWSDAGMGCPERW